MREDPLVILAGIKQFGLAADGSDLRDLEAAILREREAVKGWRNIDSCPSDGRRILVNDNGFVDIKCADGEYWRGQYGTPRTKAFTWQPLPPTLHQERVDD